MKYTEKIARLKKKAQFCAELLDECSSQDEFRFKCTVINKDPEKIFEPYGEYIKTIRGYDSLGINVQFTLNDWWAFEKLGTSKPDPYCLRYIDHLTPKH